MVYAAFETIPARESQLEAEDKKIRKFGGEYRNRTGVHGFAIQKERKRKQRLKGAKQPLTKSEQKAKVSKLISDHKAEDAAQLFGANQ